MEVSKIEDKLEGISKDSCIQICLIYFFYMLNKDWGLNTKKLMIIFILTLVLSFIRLHALDKYNYKFEKFIYYILKITMVILIIKRIFF